MQNRNIEAVEPVHAKELEECVLGAIMLYPDALPRVASWLKPHHFYSRTNELIYSAHLKMWEEGRPIDIWTTHVEMKSRGQSEETGGAYYISILTNRVASTAHIEAHGQIIIQYWVQRELAKTGGTAYARSGDASVNAFELAEEIDARVQQILEEANKQGSPTFRDIANETLSQAGKNEAVGYPTGFQSIDNLTGGWYPSDLVIIAARPGMGKTAYTLCNAAFAGKPCGVISLEMPEKQLGKRLQSITTGVPFSAIYRDELNEKELQNLHKSHEHFASLPISPNFSASTIGDIRATIATWVRKDKIECVFIDQLSFITSKGQTRDQEVGVVTRGLKKIAMEFNIPIVLLHQLSRDVAKRTDKRPQLTDLRDSGNVENDADVVMFIHRPEYYGIMEAEYGSTIGVAEIIFAKFRNGSPCNTQLMWRGETASFADGLKRETEPEPF